MACISGFTLGGYYNYIDCCGLNQSGLSPGLEGVCVDITYSGSAIGVLLDSGSTCSISCDQGPLSYNFQVTGVCSAATGSVVINGFGGTLPYTIDPITPLGSGLSTTTGNGPFTFTGLTGGTYVFRLNDSLGLQNNEIYFNVNISECFFANIYDVTGTTCGLDNGAFYVTATSLSSPYTIILYDTDGFNQLQTTNTLPYYFTNLPQNIYYAEIYDYGYSTAVTENVIISASTGVDFGFWKVNTSNCVISGGKLAVTGVTGVGPYTYLWSNGETGQIITGLTEGTYTCTVTDGQGCVTTKSETVTAAPPLGVGFVNSVSPSCFSSDGSLVYTITGGTRPLYFSASTGQVGYTFSDTFTITNLNSGTHFINVRDANYCPLNLTGFLSTPNGFNVVDTIITNSNCSQNNGGVYVEILGTGGNFYTYLLSGQTNGSVFVNTSQNQFNSFTNLSNDTYQLIISATGTNCVYTDTVSVNSIQKFSVSAVTTGSTCGEPNGGATIIVGSGFTGVLDYVLNGPTPNQLIDEPFSSYTFNNLSSGSYTINVTDFDGCTVDYTFNIPTTPSIITSINTINCTDGSNGEAQVVIYDGSPTFTYEWSDNISGSQSGSTVTGLTAGTYSVIITDSNGCFDEQKFEILCTGVLVSNYEIYNICENKFETTTGQKRGFYEMLNEGFVDLTSGYTNCYFSSATFTCEIDINGSAFTQTFYTATTLNDVPQDTLWVSTIEDILSTVSQVGSYTIDIIRNQISVKSNCDGDYDPLGGTEISIGVSINYDIYCLV